ncbi:hypothetical protein M092_0823 [Parabacteroides distasonis str. 3776 D15 iv]|uniref:Uncharacterized protein n=1 Tax=Parabacteroides distasonis str. 3776 D15 i TaxID=1339342 RepID=A0AB34LJQ3_PARDI|nr:hypothetical protein M091_3692 [Parabacteroides distasonis str. 3776 D15 i]KDS72078.1 hypothetical protein M092_0823 [Parabacteroides distasonis str. 3776 D15 iv]
MSLIPACFLLGTENVDLPVLEDVKAWSISGDRIVIASDEMVYVIGL